MSATEDTRPIPLQLAGIRSPEEILDWQVGKLREWCLASARDADHFRKRLPAGMFIFIPAPPPFLSLAEAMSLVRLEGNAGVSQLEDRYHKDLIRVLEVPSLLVGVDDGVAVGSRRTSREKILAAGRTPVTTWQGIVEFILFPWKLKTQGADFFGSAYDLFGVPCVSLLGGVPILRGGHRGNPSVARWGATSYAGVVV